MSNSEEHVKMAKKAKFDPELNEQSNIVTVVPMKTSASTSDLRAKLHAKIELLRKSRGADNATPKNKRDLLQKRLEKKNVPKKRRRVDEDTTAVNTDIEEHVVEKKQKTIVEDVSFGIMNFGDEKKKAGIDTMSKLKKVSLRRC